MKEYTFRFNEVEASVIMEALTDNIQRSVERLSGDMPDPVKMTLHTDAVMRTAELLNGMTQTIAYGTEGNSVDHALVEYEKPTKVGIYLAKAYPGGKGNSCEWYILHWDGERWTNKNGRFVNFGVKLCTLLEEDA